MDCTASPEGGDYRFRSEVRAAVREGAPSEIAALVAVDEIRAIVAHHPGQLERKAAYWAKKVLFGSSHELVKVQPRPKPSTATL